MEVIANNFLSGDPRLVDQIVYELKSQGIFDKFRKECLSDVDTKPAYQNLRQRVEGSVSSFLKQQKWKPDMNKNQVREMLRKNIYESGFLETGVERIVDQVVNPKINTMFLPQVEEVVYKFFGVEKPSRNDIKMESLKVEVSTEDLLPKDLEAVSPESVSNDKKEDLDDSLNTDDMKMEEDESPPFEPLEEKSANLLFQEDNSVDSHMSGFSGLASHESNYSSDTKGLQIDLSNQDSQMSRNSSESRLSIVTSDDNTKMEICEDSQLKSRKEGGADDEKKSDVNNKVKTDEKKMSKTSEKSKSRSDKDRRSSSSKDRSKHSSTRDKERLRNDSKSSNRTDKDRHRNKHSTGSSSHDKSCSSKDSKSREKLRTSSSSANRDSKSKSSHSDSKSKSSSSSSHKKQDKHSSLLHNSRHSSTSSSNSSNKRDKKDSKKDKDDHYSSKEKKNDRRSTDRDSNDGQSSKQSSTTTTTNDNTSKTQIKSTNEPHESSSNTGQSVDSGNSDSIQGKTPIEVEVNDTEIAISSNLAQKVKLNKPKFASNIREAMKLMKIRKQLTLLEKQNHLSLLSTKSELSNEYQINGAENNKDNEKTPTVLTKENWDALEARLYEEMSNISNSYDDTSDERSDSEDFLMKENTCQDVDKAPIKLEKEKEYLDKYVDKFEKDIENKLLDSKISKKRKTQEQADVKNNNKMNESEENGNLKKRLKRKSATSICDVLSESFSLPLSPAESDTSSDKKEESSESTPKPKRSINRGNFWANQRYSSDDLYKPRSTFASSRRRGAKNIDN